MLKMLVKIGGIGCCNAAFNKLVDLCQNNNQYAIFKMFDGNFSCHAVFY